MTATLAAADYRDITALDARTPGLGRRTAPAAPSPTPARPGRQDGRRPGPQARPSRPLSTRRSARTTGRACAPGLRPTVVATQPAAWRLTDRGIALVLVVGAMIMVAALVVIGLTAVRVTSDGYAGAGHPTSHSR